MKQAAILIAIGLAAAAAVHAETTPPLLSAEAPTPTIPPETVYVGVPQTNDPPLTPAPGPNPPFPLEAIDFDQGITNNGGYGNIPPDPHGAVSATHLVNIVNTSIEWYNRSTGTRETSQLMGYSDLNGSTGFFGPLSPANLLFDPKVIYDQYQNRFVAVALERVDSGSNPDAGNISRILLAVSNDSNPNNGWCFQAIDSKLNQGGLDYWADYPGFAVDEAAIYVTANTFAFAPSSSGTNPRLWIVDKGVAGGLYACGTSTVTVHTPPNTYGLTLQPAHVYGAGGVPGTVGTIMVGYSGLTDGSNEYLGIFTITNPLSPTPGFTEGYLNVGDIENATAGMPTAPQPSSAATIATNDRRTLNAVWRNNSLWTVAEVVPNTGSPSAGEATAHWWQIDATNAASNTYGLTQQGDVGGDDIAANTYTFMPSIAVNANGDAAIGFSYSGANVYAGAAYTWRQAGDAAGTVQESVVYAPGQGPYYRVFGGSRNRWGDYTATVVDVDELNFCFYNEYAQTPGTEFPAGEDGRWGTVWACTDLSESSFLLCDADGDGDVDRLDLRVISSARGQTATGPDDPRDANGDGVISTVDTRTCIPQCDLSGCAILP